MEVAGLQDKYSSSLWKYFQHDILPAILKFQLSVDASTALDYKSLNKFGTKEGIEECLAEVVSGLAKQQVDIIIIINHCPCNMCVYICHERRDKVGGRALPFSHSLSPLLGERRGGK